MRKIAAYLAFPKLLLICMLVTCSLAFFATSNAQAHVHRAAAPQTVWKQSWVEFKNSVIVNPFSISTAGAKQVTFDETSAQWTLEVVDDSTSATVALYSPTGSVYSNGVVVFTPPPSVPVVKTGTTLPFNISKPGKYRLAFRAIQPGVALHHVNYSVTDAANTQQGTGPTAVPGVASTDYQLHGCPEGYACIYPEGAGWNNDQPSQKFYHFRTYQLSNQYGTHYVINNQVGGASFWLCTDWNGNNCQYVPVANWAAVNLTPINSVKLSATPDPTWQP